MKRIAWIAVAAAVLVLIVLSMRPQPVPADIGTPETRTVREFIAEEAKTRLRDEYLIDMPVTGTLKRIALDVGDVVEAGAVIAEMDAFDLEQRVRGLEYLIRQAEAQIAGVDSGKPKSEDIDTAAMRAQEMRNALRIAEKEREIAGINFEEAERDFNRIQRLHAQGVASQSMLDDADRAFKAAREQREAARLAVASARKNVEISDLASSRVTASIDDNEYLREVYRAEIKRLEADLAIARSDLEKAVLRAPVTGPVLEKFIENTRFLAAGTPIMTIGDLSTMEIESDVLSEEVVAVEPGDSVEIIGKALGDATITGKVGRIYPSAFQKISSLGIEQQRVKTIIAFDNSELNLRAGTRLDVRIIIDQAENALAVPERALFRRDGVWHVFAVEGGKAQLRPVSVGLKNDTWAQITDGLAADEEIVLEPRNDLEPGSRLVAR